MENRAINVRVEKTDGASDGALAPEVTPVEASEDCEPSFKVVCKRSNVTVNVGPKETILEALEHAGLHPQFSCREGVCGTCEARILAGRPDHRDSVLSPSEKLSGKTMTICVSRSQDPVLELDL